MQDQLTVFLAGLDCDYDHYHLKREESKCCLIRSKEFISLRLPIDLSASERDTFVTRNTRSAPFIVPSARTRSALLLASKEGGTGPSLRGFHHRSHCDRFDAVYWPF